MHGFGYDSVPPDVPPDADPGDPVRSFGFRLWHLQHGWTRRLEAALAPLGLTHMQFVLLRASDWLARRGERPTQARLAACIATDRMLVSKVLRLLETKGLLVRPAHPDDPRAHHVVLTEAGRRALARAVPVALCEQDRFFGRLGAARQAEFGAMLDALLALDGNPIVTVATKPAGPAPDGPDAEQEIA